MPEKINYTAPKAAPVSIAELKADGYQGCDKSLAISLFEYDLAWKTDRDPASGAEDYRFLYRNEHGRFSWANFNKELDPKREFSWIDDKGWQDAAATNGMSAVEFLKLPLPQLIGDLYRHYGAQNVFGTDYHGGMHIAGDDRSRGPLDPLSSEDSRAQAADATAVAEAEDLRPETPADRIIDRPFVVEPRKPSIDQEQAPETPLS